MNQKQIYKYVIVGPIPSQKSQIILIQLGKGLSITGITDLHDGCIDYLYFPYFCYVPNSPQLP